MTSRLSSFSRRFSATKPSNRSSSAATSSPPSTCGSSLMAEVIPLRSTSSAGASPN
ncbi:hypothetical protein Hanom_Chr00s000001g01593041 [Helianthus anomalus]